MLKKTIISLIIGTFFINAAYSDESEIVIDSLIESVEESVETVTKPIKETYKKATTPTGENQWAVFGERIMLAAPESVKKGHDLEKARWIASQIAKKMAAENIPPNVSYTSRIEGAVDYGWQNRDRGSCGWVADVLRQAFKGAGLKYVPQDIMGTKSLLSPSTYTDIVNSNHGAIAVVDNGKVYLFDIWQYGRSENSFAGFEMNDRWNAVSYEDWVEEMKKQGYETIGLVDESNDMQKWIEQETFNQKCRRQAGKKNKPENRNENITKTKSRPEPQYYPDTVPQQSQRELSTPTSAGLAGLQKCDRLVFKFNASGHYSNEDSTDVSMDDIWERRKIGVYINTSADKNCRLIWSGGGFTACGSYAYEEGKKRTFSISGTVSDNGQTLQSLIAKGTDQITNSTSVSTQEFTFSVSNVPLKSKNDGGTSCWARKECRIWSGKINTTYNDGGSFQQWGSSSDGSQLNNLEISFPTSQSNSPVDF